MPVIDPKASLEKPLAFFSSSVPFMTFHTDADHGSRVFKFHNGVLTVYNEEDLDAVRHALSNLPYPFRNYVDEIDTEAQRLYQDMMARAQAIKKASRGAFSTADLADGSSTLAARLASTIAQQTGEVLSPQDVAEMLKEEQNAGAGAGAETALSGQSGADLAGATGEVAPGIPRGESLAGFRLGAGS